MSQAVEGPTTDHLHASHIEPDDDCGVCLDRTEEPADPQAPERGWYLDGEGYVKTDA